MTLEYNLQSAGISCMLVFAEVRKLEYPEKKPQSKVEKQHKLSKHRMYNLGIEPCRVTLVGDECCHHCTIPAPHTSQLKISQLKISVSPLYLGSYCLYLELIIWSNLIGYLSTYLSI